MFRELHEIKVYVLTERLSNFIWEIVLQWNYFEKDTVGKQLVRAVDSIGANLAESHGRFHYLEKKKFAYYARGSFEETKSWIRKCKERSLLKPDEIEVVESYIKEIGPKLNALINTFKK